MIKKPTNGSKALAVGGWASSLSLPCNTYRAMVHLKICSHLPLLLTFDPNEDAKCCIARSNYLLPALKLVYKP